MMKIATQGFRVKWAWPFLHQAEDEILSDTDTSSSHRLGPRVNDLKLQDSFFPVTYESVNELSV
ncbi:hypothetical protein PsorP6_012729 [Peronosclerospora sorghi]|uniref:Uncharacterized protein n=1 Tax=Peronosclerospora sorghi TaxID=230839 RepID=A0ACC0WJN0_9STRA|nr:hypothetical protein PsorP6_012729 [Peronosclerospora sorghi]